LRKLLPLAACLLIAAGCSINVGRIQNAPASTALTTLDLARSMIYLARTDSGVIAIDLGWVSAGPRLRAGLRRLDARPEDVEHVFLTHSHRDHIRGWRAVRGASFHLALLDVATFTGGVQHRDLSSRVAAGIFRHAYPTVADSLDVRPFAGDTFFTFGRDTVRAFLMPGHTAGSAAYLFRNVLFVGDALAYAYLQGFRLAKRAFTVDWDQNRASVASLWRRVEPYRVDWVCTAHAKCARLEELQRRGIP
jgi:glyoxylase-like metal-dependent hydrolase (beta-lactamase superfamily II)